MTQTPTPRDGIMEIELYVGGKGHLAGVENVLKLSSNENPFGCSPKAQEAFCKEAEFLHVYPSSDHGELRDTLAELHGLNADRIMLGNGSDELISLICQCYAGPGDEVIFTEHGFLMYKICARSNGATPVEVTEAERHTDVDAILAACTENTRLVFIANPNNPTGTMISVDEITRLADGIPLNAILVLDGAYAEFVPSYDGGASLVEERENVVMLRTFSKVYGLGALRLGWGYFPQAIQEVLARVRGPFNVNAAALAAGLAAAQDREFLNKCLDANASARETLIADLNALGIATDPSHANFVLARFDSEELADAADAHLQANGILVRAVKSYGLPQCLRITVGKPADCKRIANLMADFMKAQAA